MIVPQQDTLQTPNDIMESSLHYLKSLTSIFDKFTEEEAEMLISRDSTELIRTGILADSWTLCEAGLARGEDRRAVCSFAAKYGRLDLLKKLKACGCPWDHRTYQSAILGRHPEVMIWLAANGCPTEDTRKMSVA